MPVRLKRNRQRLRVRDVERNRDRVAKLRTRTDKDGFVNDSANNSAIRKLPRTPAFHEIQIQISKRVLGELRNHAELQGFSV